MTEKQRETLFAGCVQEMRGKFRRMCGAYAKPAERDDLLQEIFLTIWIRLPTFEGRSKMSTWAWQVALYTALNWRRKGRQKEVEEPLELYNPEEHASELCQGSPENAEIGAKGRLEVVYLALQRLPEMERTLLLMALEESPREEMAEVLGISLSALQSRLHRARQKLNHEMERIL